jgi:transposase-like protein
MSSVISDKHFHDEHAAYAYVEARLWPTGPICPHCGNADASRIRLMGGKSTRIGVRQCNECRKPFTVKIGTIFEASHVPMRLWLQAIHLLCSSKKGISSNQIHRILGVTLKTAWFMTHRIREAMRDGALSPMGGAGGIVEIDETVFGRIEGAPKSSKKMGGRSGFRNVALTLVERGGAARSFHVDGTTIATLKPIIRANVAREAQIMTDQAAWYPEIGAEFAAHETVNHAKDEYARYPDDAPIITTNTVEGYYSIFKRGMKGVYQHCKEKHLHHYLSEFDFRYSNRVKLGIGDVARADLALKGAKGKRLTYRTTGY